MMNHTFLSQTRLRSIFVMVLALVVTCSSILAQDNEPKESAETNAEAEVEKLPTLAVIGFVGKGDQQEVIAQDVAEAMTVLLSMEPDMNLVDRQSLIAIADEQAINLMGFTEDRDAVKVGRLAGAKLLVFGRVFALGGKMYITAKVVGTETSLVEAVMVKGQPGDVDSLTMELTKRLADRIRNKAATLVAGEKIKDGDLAALQHILAGKQKPRIGVVVLEEHQVERRRADLPDPACETEIKQMLINGGFQVINIGINDLANWVDDARAGDDTGWKQKLDAVDVVVTGKAFSVLRGRMGNLVSCGACAEINLIDIKTGEILVADRVTTTGIDTSENLAGKTALQEAGRKLGMSLLAYFASELPDNEPKD